MQFDSSASFFTFLLFLGLFSLLELWRPRAPHNRQYLRLSLNLGLPLASWLLLSILLPFSLIQAGALTQQRDFGLLHWLPFGITQLPLGFLALDLIFYFLHIWLHRWEFLWSLHKLHHQEKHLDATTSVRFHPMEVLISYVVKLAAILILGIGPWTVLIFELWLIFINVFNHANLSIHEKIEDRLQKVMATPDYHRIHHSQSLDQLNANFATGLSLWDQLFRTNTPSSRQDANQVHVGRL